MDEASSLSEGNLMPQTVAAAIGALIASMFLLFRSFSSSIQTRVWGNKRTSPNVIVEQRSVVPFITINDPVWSTLSKALDRHDNAISSCLDGLSASLEVAQTTEQALFGTHGPLSNSLQRRIDRLSQILEEDRETLSTLLRPFPVRKALPRQAIETEASFHESSCSDRTSGECGPSRPPPLSADDLSASYESALQVMAQLVRDWTHLGSRLRSSLYDWCRQELRYNRSPGHVLVPGAGLGRLAYDIAKDGHSVEANEVSLVMAAVAHLLFSAPQTEVVRIHPFALDYFTNEVREEQRYEAVEVMPPSVWFGSGGSLSYTLGDFSWYSTLSIASFDAVVTCFFIDTATNVYEYVAIIANLLEPGGRWINVGPLQWHMNANLKPSALELREMIQASGVFRFRHWTLDDDSMDYRMDHSSNRRTTRDEGFRPLRWVAEKVESNIRLPHLRPKAQPAFRDNSTSEKDFERHDNREEGYSSTVHVEEL